MVLANAASATPLITAPVIGAPAPACFSHPVKSWHNKPTEDYVNSSLRNAQSTE